MDYCMVTVAFYVTPGSKEDVAVTVYVSPVLAAAGVNVNKPESASMLTPSLVGDTL